MNQSATNPITPAAQDSFIASMAKGFVSVTESILTEMANEYEQRKAAEWEAKRQLVVGLINGAIAIERRLSLKDIAQYIPGCTHMSRQQLADKLGIPLTTFNAGVKSWYHIF